MERAGWEVRFIDLDLTGEPKAEIRLMRHDGRWLHARVDDRRCFIERFQRRVTESTKGRTPLNRQISDDFLGRQHFPGARALLRHLTAYVTDNALHPVALADMRAAWGAVTGAPLRLGTGGVAVAVDQVQPPKPSASDSASIGTLDSGEGRWVNDYRGLPGGDEGNGQ
jgi:hypothetical protein